jgi:hypothetical protein
VPDPETEGATTQEIAIPNPPPPPPPPPNVEPPRQRDDEIEDAEMEPIAFEIGDRGGLAPWAAVAVGVAGVPVGLFLLAALVIVGWKALRRRRRRTRPSPTARIAGAWAEAIDRCTEAGAPRMSDVTPHERVRVYVHDQRLDEVESDLRTLAGQVDRATYAAGPPADEHAAAAWQASDEVSAELRRGRNVGQRLRMQLDPRPLRRDHATHGAPPPREPR